MRRIRYIHRRKEVMRWPAVLCFRISVMGRSRTDAVQRVICSNKEAPVHCIILDLQSSNYVASTNFNSKCNLNFHIRSLICDQDGWKHGRPEAGVN